MVMQTLADAISIQVDYDCAVGLANQNKVKIKQAT